MSPTDEQKLPLVETYLNISNAFAFLTQFDKALDYINQAIEISHRCIDTISYQLDEANGITQEQK